MTTLAEIPGEVIALVAVGGSAVIAMVSIIGGIASGVAKTNQRERTKRELAAYVAEGSMTPEEAERLLKAAAPKNACGSGCNCATR